jgi:hypothetical protein
MVITLSRMDFIPTPTALPLSRMRVAGLRLNNKVAARMRELEAQVTQSWMALGTSPECSVVFAIGFHNGEVVD